MVSQSTTAEWFVPQRIAERLTKSLDPETAHAVWKSSRDYVEYRSAIT